jgi:hypothetical protein
MKEARRQTLKGLIAGGVYLVAPWASSCRIEVIHSHPGEGSNRPTPRESDLLVARLLETLEEYERRDQYELEQQQRELSELRGWVGAYRAALEEIQWATPVQRSVLQTQLGAAASQGLQLGEPEPWPYVQSIYARSSLDDYGILMGTNARGEFVTIAGTLPFSDLLYREIGAAAGQASAERAVGPQSNEKPLTLTYEGQQFAARGYETHNGYVAVVDDELPNSYGVPGHVVTFTDDAGNDQFVSIA